eukprot:TRINITY_DN6663_c0_g1_i10.p2 TRINITY_DN6663_c0_g1~~TRINITY_DN6663_c0_g1_i10.p2  ORF type:complete len:265 (+),score=51.02 TRINITY_DN6663_c0_g1_i10:797-1591(+)
MASCYKGQQSFLSVVRRAEDFRRTLQSIDPSLSHEESFLVWIQRLLEQERVAPVSARQYMTYYKMSLITPEKAYRRFLTRATDSYAKHEEKLERAPKIEDVKRAIRKAAPRVAAALSLQLATACRWVDLHLLRRQHVVERPDFLEITFVGGKTDLGNAGQTLTIPATGELTRCFTVWLQTIRQGAVFAGLQYQVYNAFLAKELGTTSRFVRIAALNAVALNHGETAAQAMGRHKCVESTREYTERRTWGNTLQTQWYSKTIQDL